MHLYAVYNTTPTVSINTRSTVPRYEPFFPTLFSIFFSHECVLVLSVLLPGPNLFLAFSHFTAITQPLQSTNSIRHYGNITPLCIRLYIHHMQYKWKCRQPKKWNDSLCQKQITSILVYAAILKLSQPSDIHINMSQNIYMLLAIAACYLICKHIPHYYCFFFMLCCLLDSQDLLACKTFMNV